MTKKHNSDSSKSSSDQRSLATSSDEKVKQINAQRLCNIQNTKDKYIGFPVGSNPIPLTCLDTQAITDMTTTIHYGSVVQPFVAVNPEHPSRITVIWENDKIDNGGSLEIGIAVSHNYGKTWIHSVVPLNICINGIIQRVNYANISYTPDGRKLFLTVMVLNVSLVGTPDTQSGIIIALSRDDGMSWSKPKFIVSSGYYLNNPVLIGNPVYDKPFVTADRNNQRYIYDVFTKYADESSDKGIVYFSRSNDGGRTWFPAYMIYNATADLINKGLSNGIDEDNSSIGNKVIVLPSETSYDPRNSGYLLNVFTRVYAKDNTTDMEYKNDVFPYQYTTADISLIKSKDHGANWTKIATIITYLSVNNLVYSGGYSYDTNGQITGGLGVLIRTGNLLCSAAINPKNGNLYVVYQTNQFKANLLPQIGLSVSRDGGHSWSEPFLVNKTPVTAANPQAFCPSVAVNNNGIIGILYHDFRNDNKFNPTSVTLTDVWVALYKEIDGENPHFSKAGIEFIKEIRLSNESYNILNGPTTTEGIMTNGDFCKITAECDQFYATYCKATNGPYTPESTLVNNSGTVLLLDNNRRSLPYISVFSV